MVEHIQMDFTVLEKLQSFKSKKQSENLTTFTFIGRNLRELSVMGWTKSVAFVVQKILCNPFSMQKFFDAVQNIWLVLSEILKFLR